MALHAKLCGFTSEAVRLYKRSCAALHAKLCGFTREAVRLCKRSCEWEWELGQWVQPASPPLAVFRGAGTQQGAPPARARPQTRSFRVEYTPFLFFILLEIIFARPHGPSIAGNRAAGAAAVRADSKMRTKILSVLGRALLQQPLHSQPHCLWHAPPSARARRQRRAIPCCSFRSSCMR